MVVSIVSEIRLIVLVIGSYCVPDTPRDCRNLVLTL